MNIIKLMKFKTNKEFKISKYSRNGYDIKIDTRFRIPLALEVSIGAIAGVAWISVSPYFVAIKIGELFERKEVMGSLKGLMEDYIKKPPVIKKPKHQLQDLLYDAIKEENYELASRVRDELKNKTIS